jgi:signal transduction histidine kinase
MPASVVLAAGEGETARLLPALEAAGLAVTRLDPAEARPAVLRAFAPRLLVLETAAPRSQESLQPYWEGQEMDDHLAILLLEPSGFPGAPAPSPEEMDEPLDRVTMPSDPREVVARIQGLLQERLIRIYRRHFHDLSQPLTIARAYSQRALKNLPPEDALRPTLTELDRQVDRIFRIAEQLQRRRME